MKVLLIEDDPTIIEMLYSYLTAHGCEVVRTSDGAEAIAQVALAIKSRPFSLMIVDVAMMYVDGYAFAKAARCFESNGLYKPSARIMFHTAYAEAFQNKALLKQAQVSADDCFIKPEGTTKLFDKLKELTQERPRYSTR